MRWSRKSDSVARDVALAAVIAWIRTISVEGELFVLETKAGREVLGFPSPSMPDSRPLRAMVSEDAPLVRFHVRSRVAGGPVRAPVRAGWRAIVRTRDLEVLERDAPHGKDRPLRLGVSEAEGLVALRYARDRAAKFLAADAPTSASGELAPRLGLRSGVAVALWTRGRLRGSIVWPPSQALRGLAQAAVLACQDTRFERLTAADLDDTVVQVSFIHAPRVALSADELAGPHEAYADKALFVSEGTRSGVYLPEIFNIVRHRSLRALATSVATEKAGIAAPGPDTVFEVCEVTELVESFDRTRAVRLEGPVAMVDDADASAAKACGEAACLWLARIQREDGALPLRVRPATGATDGLDVPRMAMTAQGLAAFGVAYDLPAAIEAARRTLAFVERARVSAEADGPNALLVDCYIGKATRVLDGAAASREKEAAVLRRLDRGTPSSPLVLAHALSFLGGVAGPSGELVSQLTQRFDAALAGTSAVSLAEWAEVAMAPLGGAGGALAARVRRWLCSLQLPSGAFPDTTTSDFTYSRGTGKIFEVLSAAPAETSAATAGALSWLRSMQYRPDSVFFIPTEHRDRVLGGLRHDAFDADAWIDAAGHLLLGLARLRGA